MGSKRVEWLDIAKGLLILLVVLGHMVTGGRVHTAIYSFHLFAFIFISGCVKKSHGTWKDFLVKDCLPIAKAYLFFAVVWVIFDFAWSIYSSPEIAFSFGYLTEYIPRAVGGVLVGNGNITGVSLGAIWYLPMLLTVKLIDRLLDVLRLKFGVWALLLGSIALHIVGVFVLNGYSKLPWYISSAFSVVILYEIGYLSKEYISVVKQKVSRLGYLLGFVVAFAVVMLGTFIINDVNLGKNSYSDPLFVLLFALLGTAMIIFISFFISSVFPVFLRNICCYFGKNSLHVMGWHSQLRLVLNALFLGFGTAVRFTAVFVLTLVLCIPLNMLSKFLLKYKRRQKND